jgi:hypothetical protein
MSRWFRGIIAACHYGEQHAVDPGSIPGRDKLFLPLFLLFCSPPQTMSRGRVILLRATTLDDAKDASDPYTQVVPFRSISKCVVFLESSFSEISMPLLVQSFAARGFDCLSIPVLEFAFSDFQPALLERLSAHGVSFLC